MVKCELVNSFQNYFIKVFKSIFDSKISDKIFSPDFYHKESFSFPC